MFVLRNMCCRREPMSAPVTTRCDCPISDLELPNRGVTHERNKEGETPTCDNGSMAVLEAGDVAEGRVVPRAALEPLEPMPVPVPVLESFGASSAFFPSLSLFLVESSSFSLLVVVVAEVLLRENLDSEGVRLVLEPVIATGGVAGGRFGGLAAPETAPLVKAIAKTVYSSGRYTQPPRKTLSCPECRC